MEISLDVTNSKWTNWKRNSTIRSLNVGISILLAAYLILLNFPKLSLGNIHASLPRGLQLTLLRRWFPYLRIIFLQLPNLNKISNWGCCSEKGWNCIGGFISFLVGPWRTQRNWRQSLSISALPGYCVYPYDEICLVHAEALNYDHCDCVLFDIVNGVIYCLAHWAHRGAVN
jgi:hypothetical protein